MSRPSIPKSSNSPNKFSRNSLLSPSRSNSVQGLSKPKDKPIMNLKIKVVAPDKKKVLHRSNSASQNKFSKSFNKDLNNVTD
jgi:hypothetical protein